MYDTSKILCIFGYASNCSLRHVELLARDSLETRRFDDGSMAFSSDPSLNRFNMPRFFAVDKEGMNAEAERCAQA